MKTICYILSICIYYCKLKKIQIVISFFSRTPKLLSKTPHSQKIYSPTYTHIKKHQTPFEPPKPPVSHIHADGRSENPLGRN